MRASLFSALLVPVLVGCAKDPAIDGAEDSVAQPTPVPQAEVFTVEDVLGSYAGVYASGYTYNVAGINSSGSSYDTVVMEVMRDTLAHMENAIRAGAILFRLNADGTLSSSTGFQVYFEGAFTRTSSGYHLEWDRRTADYHFGVNTSYSRFSGDRQ